MCRVGIRLPVVEGGVVAVEGGQLLFVHLLFLLQVVFAVEQSVVVCHQRQEGHECHGSHGGQHRPTFGTQHDEARHPGYKQQQAQGAYAVDEALQPAQCLCGPLRPVAVSGGELFKGFH